MVTVVFSPAAEDDLTGIALDISKDKPQAAINWVQKIRETCQTISHHPEVGEFRVGFGVVGCRSFSIGNYVIFFRSIGDGIEIARVIHGSRDMRNL